MYIRPHTKTFIQGRILYILTPQFTVESLFLLFPRLNPVTFLLKTLQIENHKRENPKPILLKIAPSGCH